MRPTQNNVLLKGSSGSGKTYFLVDWFCTEIIPYGKANIVCNLPIGLVPKTHFKPPEFEGETFIDRIAKRTGVENLHDRLTLLDEETLDSWSKGQGGPWDLEIEEGETYFVLDEFASYCHKSHQGELLYKWIQWFAKSRHRNIFNICISQTDRKIPRDVGYEFAERWQLSDTASKPIDPFGVAEGDFNQLISKLRGTDVAFTQVLVRIDEGGTMSNINKSKPYRVQRTMAGFELYNSFTADTAQNRKKEWQTLSWPRFVSWLYERNKGFVNRATSVLIVCSLIVAGWSWFVWNTFFKGKQGTTVQVEEKVRKESKEDVGPKEEKPERKSNVAGRVGLRPFIVDGDYRGLLNVPTEGDSQQSRKSVSTKNATASQGGSSSAVRRH